MAASKPTFRHKTCALYFASFILFSTKPHTIISFMSSMLKQGRGLRFRCRWQFKCKSMLRVCPKAGGLEEIRTLTPCGTASLAQRVCHSTTRPRKGFYRCPKPPNTKNQYNVLAEFRFSVLFWLRPSKMLRAVSLFYTDDGNCKSITLWREHKELNLDQQIRSLLPYPLGYAHLFAQRRAVSIMPKILPITKQIKPTSIVNSFQKYSLFCQESERTWKIIS